MCAVAHIQIFINNIMQQQKHKYKPDIVHVNKIVCSSINRYCLKKTKKNMLQHKRKYKPDTVHINKTVCTSHVRFIFLQQ